MTAPNSCAFFCLVFSFHALRCAVTLEAEHLKYSQPIIHNQWVLLGTSISQRHGKMLNGRSIHARALSETWKILQIHLILNKRGRSNYRVKAQTPEPSETRAGILDRPPTPSPTTSPTSNFQFHNSNAQLDLLIGELREKLDEMQGQNLEQRKRIADQEACRGRVQVHPEKQYFFRKQTPSGRKLKQYCYWFPEDQVDQEKCLFLSMCHMLANAIFSPCRIFGRHITWGSF